jgi:uncharacterized metal-binding protein YceD (DUF177 family)
MTSEALKIYVDRLKEDKIEQFERLLPPDFLDISEPDLHFESDVTVRGEAYVAGDGLVLHIDICAIGVIPCSICNERVEVPIQLKGLYHVEPLEGIKAGIFDMGPVIRENLLLEIPAFAECQNGNCPQRKIIGKYLKKKDVSDSLDDEEEGYRPFKDLM